MNLKNEIKNWTSLPYNAVQWIEEDLANELSSQMKKYLNIIPERIKRMDDLIDALLHYARISRSQAEKEYVSVNLFLEGIVDSIVPAGFKVQIQEMPSFKTEKVLLEQVFSNLISNSVNYKSDTPGKINITYKELKNFYEFSVADNGIGIDSKYHEKIFVIFQTLREKHAKESTGIGLAIVHKIIEDQQCSIKVESKIGHGASFIFTWPKN
jgi:light-regulated signal transduction histidine kinase (bacteriophytochrome)